MSTTKTTTKSTVSSSKKTTSKTSTSTNKSTMTTTINTATKASAALNKLALLPKSFPDNNEKLIRYELKCSTPALKKQFPGVDGIRIAAYISGNAYITEGLTRTEDEESTYFSKEEFKNFLIKHKLPDITIPTVFGASRQLITMKNMKTPKSKENFGTHYNTYISATATKSKPATKA